MTNWKVWRAWKKFYKQQHRKLLRISKVKGTNHAAKMDEKAASEINYRDNINPKNGEQND